MARIVLLGAGHCHIEVARRAGELTRAGHELLLVSPEREHPYSGMGPGMLGGTYSLQQILLPAAELVERGGGRFIAAAALSHNPQARTLQLSTAHELNYDVLSVNTGSELGSCRGTAADTSGAAAPAERPVYAVKPIRQLAAARSAIEQRCRARGNCRVAVVGGGAAGVELAGNAAQLLRRCGVIDPAVDLYSTTAALAGLEGSRLRYVRRRLERAGVTVHAGGKVDPSQLRADVTLLATGIRPVATLAGFGLRCAADGALRVDRHLRAEGTARVFAVGDSAWFNEQPLDRVGVYAVRMQGILMHNLALSAAVADGNAEARQLERFEATGVYLGGLNLGFGRGILFRGRWTIRGRPAFTLKDAIDRRFMHKFQQSSKYF